MYGKWKVGSLVQSASDCGGSSWEEVSPEKTSAQSNPDCPPLAWPACTVERFLSWGLSLAKGRTRPQGQLLRPPLLTSFTLKALRGWPGCRASTRSLSPWAGTGVWAHGAQTPRMGGEVFWEHGSAVDSCFGLPGQCDAPFLPG